MKKRVIDPEREIAIIWSVMDVQSDGIRPDLSDDQALKVLKYVECHHNCNYGISWDTIKMAAEELFPSERLL